MIKQLHPTRKMKQNSTVRAPRGWIYIPLLLGLSMLSTPGRAQQAGDEEGMRRASFLLKKVVVPPSPEAANLGKYGDAEINYYTGAMSLGIALHQLGGKDLQHSLSLSYDGSGNKVDNLPSWVGLGWALQGGGVITRAVQGNPDLQSNYFDKAALINPYSRTPNADLIAEYDLMYKIVRGEIETQPDNFYFNAGGLSGKFYIDPYKVIYQKEKKDVVITPTYHPISGDITSFTLKDALGNTYVFSATEQTVHQLDDDYGTLAPAYTQYTYTSSWYLTSITNAQGTETLEFTYETLSLPFSAPINSWAYQSISYGDGTTASAGNGCPNMDVCPTTPSYSNGGIASITINNRKYLQQISYKVGGVVVEQVELVSSANPYPYAYGGKKLDAVRIKRGVGGATALKEFAFTYDGSTNRLTLKSVQEKQYQGAGLAKEPYRFTYNATQLPRPNSSSIDHWGYYNDNGDNSPLIPAVTPYCGGAPYPGEGAYREPSESLMQAGILTRVEYPTRGYSDFIYEAHRVAPEMGACSSDDRLAGGLRIRQINNYDYTGTLLTQRRFRYLKAGATEGSPNSSSGLLLSEPSYLASSSYTQYSMNTYPEYCTP
ncbi:MAG: hypothetical protein H6555_12950 [Lewinellaceae bacterium]|nr:hypothetical protein [Lewinellaceae bacterium]